VLYYSRELNQALPPGSLSDPVLSRRWNGALYNFTRFLMNGVHAIDRSLHNRTGLDAGTLKMIIVFILITLHDLSLSNTPRCRWCFGTDRLHKSGPWSLESGLAFWVPVGFPLSLLTLWLTARIMWVRRVALVFLAWVTLRLAI